MTILLLGKTGQVGYELLNALAPLGPIEAPGRKILDLTDSDSLIACVREIQPRVIINAAAYTAVDQAEKELELAMAANGTAPGILAEESKRLGIPLIHYSTDYVFDGKKNCPYNEDDIPAPINTYGRTKLAGEEAIQAVGSAYLILRTSWVYGLRGNNFLRTMLRLFRERETLKVVDDQIGAPTNSRMIAQATATIAAQCLSPRPAIRLEELGGVYHLAAGGATSWFAFAGAIAEADPARSEQRLRDLTPIPTAEYPTPAARPLNSRLDCTALRNQFGVALPDWKESLIQLMDYGQLSDK